MQLNKNLYDLSEVAALKFSVKKVLWKENRYPEKYWKTHSKEFTVECFYCEFTMN